MAHNAYLVRHCKRFLLIVRNAYCSYSKLFLYSLYLKLHLVTQVLIESAKRFIKEKQRRIVYNGSCKSTSLLLTARKLLGEPLFHSVKLYQLDNGVDSFSDLIFRKLSQLQWICDVFCYCHVRKKRIILKKHTDVSLVRFLSGDVLAVNKYLSSVRGFKSCDYF